MFPDAPAEERPYLTQRPVAAIKHQYLITQQLNNICVITDHKCKAATQAEGQEQQSFHLITDDNE